MTNYNYTLARLTAQEFKVLSTFIYEQYGIKMPPVKKTLLECRLQKRLRDLKMEDFRTYLQYLFSKEGQEKEVMLMANVITTNKTDFFRESAHFEFLLQLNWSSYFGGEPGGKVLQAWSAGCSTGEEPYSLAMTLNEISAFDYRILATDLSQQVLEKGAEAIYPQKRTLSIPPQYKKKYFMRHKDPDKPLLRIVPEIRKKISFRELNFMDPVYELSGPFDLIFCRNVLIYFDRLTQEKLIGRLCRHLKEGGYLFLGHSESISDFKLPLMQLQTTVFRKI